MDLMYWDWPCYSCTVIKTIKINQVQKKGHGNMLPVNSLNLSWIKENVKTLALTFFFFYSWWWSPFWQTICTFMHLLNIFHFLNQYLITTKRYYWSSVHSLLFVVMLWSNTWIYFWLPSYQLRSNQAYVSIAYLPRSRQSPPSLAWWPQSRPTLEDSTSPPPGIQK